MMRKREAIVMDRIFYRCHRCGECCQGESTVSLNEEDQQRMLTFLGISRQEAIKSYWRITDTQIQMKIVDGHCIFYKGGCTIHAGRPWRCRQWPFVDAIVTDRVNFDIIRSSCPGIGEDVSYDEVCSFIDSGGLLVDSESGEK